MPDTSTRSPVPLTLAGSRDLVASLPDLFAGTTRSADGNADIFLPPGYLEPLESYDVGPIARSAHGQRQQRLVAQDDDIIARRRFQTRAPTSADRA